MCGRYTLINAARAYEAYLRRGSSGLPGPRYNVAPGQRVGVVRMAEGGERELQEFLWGFIPRWSKPNEKPRPIVNARSETAAVKPAFREAFRQRRCLALADGFYEWRRHDSGREPYCFRLRGGRPFGLAAIWEEWRPEGGETVRTVCLLTTVANSLLTSIHDRMPVMLDPEAAGRWLEADADEAATGFPSLLKPYSPDEMEALKVNSWVNKADHEGPRCLEPPDEDQPEQLSLL